MREYRTQDLFLGSFLYYSGLKLTEIRQKENDRRMIFVFEDTDDRRELIQKYWLCEDSVSAKKLFDSFRSLRDRLFAERQSREI